MVVVVGEKKFINCFLCVVIGEGCGEEVIGNVIGEGFFEDGDGGGKDNVWVIGFLVCLGLN